MTKLVEPKPNIQTPMAVERTEADLEAIRTTMAKSEPCRIPSCLYTYHAMKGAVRGLFPESPIFVFHRELSDGNDVWMTIRIVKYIPNRPELTIESNSKATNFAGDQRILDGMFAELHRRFPALLNGHRRFLLIGQKPLQDTYEKYMLETLNGIYKPAIFPTYLYFMNPEQQNRVMNMELPLPEGYRFDKADPETDAEKITKTWIHARPGDLEQTKAKLSNLPSALIRHVNEGAVAFEVSHPCEFENHLFVLPEHRRKGLGNAVEMRLSQLCIENGTVPFKTVEFYNKAVIESTEKNDIWSRWDYVDGSPVHCEYRQYYPREHFPSNL